MLKLGKQMVFNAKWHNKLGYATIILTLWLAITGMCLRPPLMIPLAMNKTTEKVKNGNVWHDKLRAIRWDAAEGQLACFYLRRFSGVDEHFCQKPVSINKEAIAKDKSDGSECFRKRRQRGGWLIGSFSGMFRWNPEKNLIVDYFRGSQPRKSMIPISSSLVSGYSKDFFGGKEVIFDYSKGAS